MAIIDDLELQNELLSEQLETNRINSDVVREQVSLAKQLSDIAKISNEQALKINKTNRDLTSLSKQLVDQANEREKLLRSERDIERDINKSLDIQKSLDTEILQLQQKSLLTSGREKDLLDDIISGLEDQKRLNSDNTLSLGHELALSQKINSAFGIGGTLLKGWSGVLDKIGIDTSNIAEQTRNQLSDLEREGKLRDGFSGKLQGLVLIGKNVGKSLMSGLKDPLVLAGFLVTQLVSSLFKFDSMVGETAKTFGTSYKEASKLNQEMTRIAANTTNTFITTEALVNAQNELVTSLGTNAAISGDILINYTELTKQAGYSVESATTLSKLSGITGKSSKEIVTQYLGQVKALGLHNKLAINGKALLNDISNVSKGLLATYSQQPGKLAEAAFEAKKLGSSIKEIEGISKSLLDIESSISSEFEAEVMTGKQLNLERARYFALTNDIAGVAKEINKQGIDLNSWSGMNVLQQESIAKSMGMSKDQMAGMLLESNALSKLGMQDNDENRKKLQYLKEHGGSLESINELGKEEYDRQLKSTTVQERFVALTEKLKELFIGMAGPVMDVVSPLLDLVSTITAPISWISEKFGEWGGQISSLIGPLGSVGKLLKGIAMLAVGFAAYSAFASLATTGPIGVGLGAIAAAAITAAGTSFLGSIKDGQIDANGGLMVSGPKGSIQLDNEDTFIGNKNGIIAGTDLGKKDNKSITPISSSSNDITTLASTLGNKMDLMINKLDTLVGVMSKGMVVNLDGVRVSQELGTPMAMSNRRV